MESGRLSSGWRMASSRGHILCISVRRRNKHSRIWHFGFLNMIIRIKVRNDRFTVLDCSRMNPLKCWLVQAIKMRCSATTQSFLLTQNIHLTLSVRILDLLRRWNSLIVLKWSHLALWPRHLCIMHGLLLLVLTRQLIIQNYSLWSWAIHRVQLKVTKETGFLHSFKLLEQLFSAFREHVIFWVGHLKHMEWLIKATTVCNCSVVAFSLL